MCLTVPHARTAPTPATEQHKPSSRICNRCVPLGWQLVASRRFVVPSNQARRNAKPPQIKPQGYYGFLSTAPRCHSCRCHPPAPRPHRLKASKANSMRVFTAVKLCVRPRRTGVHVHHRRLVGRAVARPLEHIRRRTAQSLQSRDSVCQPGIRECVVRATRSGREAVSAGTSKRGDRPSSLCRVTNCSRSCAARTLLLLSPASGFERRRR